MTLDVLLSDVGAVPPVPVCGLTENSRLVSKGDAFVAVAGALNDGHEFAADAVTAGAVAVLAERALDPAPAVPVIVVPELKRRRGELAARLYGEPSQDLYCVGVTGTNGKTSIACFVTDMAARLGIDTGYLGTVGWGRLGDLRPSTLTTPDAITVQRRLAEFHSMGCRWAVLEASSHALTQDRLNAVAFDVAVLSNLSRDHLDYHQDLASYGAAKARLFTESQIKTAVINADDEFGQKLISQLHNHVNVIGYGSGDGRARGKTVEVSWRSLEFSADGIRGELITPWGNTAFAVPLFGEFSVANLAAAVSVLCAAGSSLEDVVGAASHLAAVPGRMEFFQTAGRPTVVVDFAHTPDALEKVLTALRKHVRGRLLCVFGCGGDRDRGKRPLMAHAASVLADAVWLTSDNPRSEDPQRIIRDMRAGLALGCPIEQQVDRKVAISEAILEAGPDDVVLVAGKGHEDYQEVNGQRHPFSDRRLVQTLLATERQG